MFLCVRRIVILKGLPHFLREETSVRRLIKAPLQHCLKKEALHHQQEKSLLFTWQLPCVCNPSKFCVTDSLLIFFPKVVLEKIPPPWKLVALQIYSNFSFRNIPSIVTTHYPPRTVFPFYSTVNSQYCGWFPSVFFRLLLPEHCEE